jgi:alpha-galactosidase
MGASAELIVNGRLGIEVSPNLTFRLLRPGEGSLAAGRLVLEGQPGLPEEPDETYPIVKENLTTHYGPAQRHTARSVFDRMAVTLTIDRYDAWPDAFLVQWTLENHGLAPFDVDRLDAPRLELGETLKAPLWTFQGAAVRWGQDFAFPLPIDYERDNYLGHLQNGEGGGIPLACVWSQETGLALAHVELQPLDWYLPVENHSPGRVSLALEERSPLTIAPGEIYRSPQVLLAAFQGDFYAPLALYRDILSASGVRPADPGPESYQPAWCSWGYEFDVRPEDMLEALPKVRELGLRWLTLDDRWFDCYGDWNPRGDTFPGGEDQMRAMVDAIHRASAYAQIWWYPLCVEDGHGQWDSHTYGIASLFQEHPDWLILNQDGTVARNNRGLAMLDPSLPAVQQHLSDLTRRFIRDWDFDGHKLDNIYTVPACYNPTHHHRRPQESTEAFGEAYRTIFETTRALKPHSVTQICPCGTPPTFSLLPFMDQSVTADPTSSAQVRQRIKFYKALLGSRAAVFADHVELSDNGIDFASALGTGGVPGTKFVWPPDPALRDRLAEWWGLDAEKEALYRQWFHLYAAYPLAKGEYLNLYDLGFDHPEAHAIRYAAHLFFAFYTPHTGRAYHGKVELRGLDEGRTYLLKDYVHDRPLAVVSGPRGELEVNFTGFLLVEAAPQD